MARPIEHPPDPERGELAGETDPATTQLQRIIVTLAWDDGTKTEHRAFTHHWTHTHVRVIVELDHDLPRRVHVLWVRADQVRRNTAPPGPGEPVPAPEVGPTAVRHHAG